MQALLNPYNLCMYATWGTSHGKVNPPHPSNVDSHVVHGHRSELTEKNRSIKGNYQRLMWSHVWH